MDEYLADNLDVLEPLYHQWLSNPSSVDPSLQQLFLSFDAPLKAKVSSFPPAKEVEHSVLFYPQVNISFAPDLRIFNLIQAYRAYGHLKAHVNPLLEDSENEPEELKLETLGFSKQELSSLFPTCGVMESEKAPLLDIILTLQTIYCTRVGFEYMGLKRPGLEAWLQNKIERNRLNISPSLEKKRQILENLNKSELFESFIHTKYVGQKRFSIEGAETLVPMLAEIIQTGSGLGVAEFMIGMAHRGRLNVLSNILDKSYTDIFSEFEEGYIPGSFEGSGDVKYHKGYTSILRIPQGDKELEVKINLLPNPSHLESVNAVVEGFTKAKQVMHGPSGEKRAVPILIHGDAALAGQGVVYETMQLSQVEGYATGGTLHLVINNQVGFTTLPEEGRSTRYCTDIAKAFGAPVFHVNAEDPEACVYVSELAMQIRQEFHCDVFVELVCYRKYGHNETDEPSFTQPLQYQLIRKKRPIRELYRDQLIHHNAIEKYMAETLEEEFKKALHKAMEIAKQPLARPEVSPSKPAGSSLHHVLTGVPLQQLKDIALQLTTLPEGFSIHSKLESLLKERRSMVTEEVKPIDWGMAETLAYATIVWDGMSVRLSGQDCRRGTFSHRHASLVDQKNSERYTPLQHLRSSQGRFEVYNSPLSEFAVLGFEYGYSVADENTLVLWEAQFGDFANGAQVVIDQYIATAEQKWGQRIDLTLLLPHGYEGQGPEHSSGRIERFLSLCGNDNLFVVQPTTPAQMFHLLRRQVLDTKRKPLIVFTPKGLLRHPQCVSSLDQLSEGSFLEIIDDPQAVGKEIKKLVFCSGRIYYDLLQERIKEKADDLALVRIEQLYPLHIERLQEIIASYRKTEEIYWVQDEPSNMGAWDYMRPILKSLMQDKQTIKYVGRPRSASPAVGSHAVHKKQHQEMMRALFGKREPSIFEIAGTYRA